MNISKASGSSQFTIMCACVYVHVCSLSDKFDERFYFGFNVHLENTLDYLLSGKIPKISNVFKQLFIP